MGGNSVETRTGSSSFVRWSDKKSKLLSISEVGGKLDERSFARNNSSYISNSVTSFKVFSVSFIYYFFTNKLTKQHIYSRRNLIFFFPLQFFHFLLLLCMS